MQMKRSRLLSLIGIVTLLVGLTVAGTGASSHREAPLIIEDPLADNTDVYAFVSPDRPDTVTLIANYVPFQLPAGGPNFYRFSDDVLYELHIDNDGDAVEDIVFAFEFQTQTVDPNTFLYNTGPITFSGGAYQNWNRPQTYRVTLIRHGESEVLGEDLLTPPNNVGPRSTPNYPDLVRPAIHQLPGDIRSFAGQRDDPFFADLGRIFDLLGVVTTGGTDYLAGLNVNSIALQVPKRLLRGQNDDVIGVWATASRRQVTVLNGDGTRTGKGHYVQVSRLGHPLVNEVVIPLGEKDRFNATRVGPGSDVPFLPYVLNPEVARLLRVLGLDPDAPTTDRLDLVTVFLTGVPGLTQPANVAPAEVLRLNLAIAPSTGDPNAVNRLGVLGGELDGFPNGRRLADDVVDIAFQAVAGILCQPGGVLVPLVGECRASTVNPRLGDGVDRNDRPFQGAFPYLADPYAPYGPDAYRTTTRGSKRP